MYLVSGSLNAHFRFQLSNRRFYLRDHVYTSNGVAFHLFLSVISGNDNTCSKSTTSEQNTSFHGVPEDTSHSTIKTSSNLYQSVFNVYHDKSRISRRITRSGLSPADDLSLNKNDVDIFTADGSIIGADHVVQQLYLHSSSPSSQLNAEPHVISEKSSDQLHDNLQLDLNETISTDTFQAGNDSDISLHINAEETISLETVADLDDGGVVNNLTIIKSPSEDIPSFREWTEKHLAEKEKEKVDDNATNVLTNGKHGKMRNKNYASLDCGAKILLTNPEAKSAGCLLSNSRDEYLLSACNSKIWFIVELCEAIQLKKIELANFELFSSSPKEFSVSISDRFPSRDWTIVGEFTAADVKSIQSFDFELHHFAKYIKVEFNSHYGKEHFCPLSLFRVYGTSELEVLETVDENGELDSDNGDSDFDVNGMSLEVDSHGKKAPTANNLFGSAKEAVINIVKKAAEVLVISSSDGSRSNKSNENIMDSGSSNSFSNCCVTLRYSIVCQDCKEDFFHSLYSFMSCHLARLEQILLQDLVWKPLIKYNICMAYGFRPFYLSGQTTSRSSAKFQIGQLYVPSLLSNRMVVALCNLLAIAENRIGLNSTASNYLILNKTVGQPSSADSKYVVYNTQHQSRDHARAAKLQPSSFGTAENTTGKGFVIVSQPIDAGPALIKPSKTSSGSSDSDGPPVVPSINTIPNLVPSLVDAGDDQTKPVTEEPESSPESDHVEVAEDGSLDSLISELERTEESQQANAPVAARKPAVQKESVFVRLANRIKALERNMSLSGQYLEELSKSYKKQVEDMQRVLSEVLNRESKRLQEVTLLTGKVGELTDTVESLLTEKQSWSYKALLVGQHSLIVFLEIAIFVGILCLCRGIPKFEISKRKFSLEWRRRKSVVTHDNKDSSGGFIVKPIKSQDDLNFRKPYQEHRRRPSEEAMKSYGSTHQHLLISDNGRSSKAESRRRKRKRKELLLMKSNVNAMNLETGEGGVSLKKQKKNSLAMTNAPLSRSASVSEIDDHVWRGRSMLSSRSAFAAPKKNIYTNGEGGGGGGGSFMKTATATSSRMKRLSTSSNQFGGANNLLSPVHDASSDHDSSSLPSTPTKVKKVHGFKKIVRKFF